MNTKLKKYWDILSDINWCQTWYMYKRVRKPRSSSIRVLNRSNIKIASTATIEMGERSFFEINRQDYIKTKERSTLYLGDHAVLKLSGAFTMHGHSSIMVHDGAHLEIGSNTYLNGGCIDCSYGISIGDKCAIADGVRIMDNSWHTAHSLAGGGNKNRQQSMDRYWSNDFKSIR